MKPFFNYVLRTSDVAAARSFYARVLGDRALDVLPLHEQAVARGARPHWLGFIDVGDVERAAAAFGERGATALAPIWVNPEGLKAAVMRDPGGAVIALARPPQHANPDPSGGPDVAWHLLNTADVERAKANYGELFGWEMKEAIDLGSDGVLHPFAYAAGGEAAGALIDIGARPGVHPHWLFNMRVAALEPAMEAARSAGGLVLGPFTWPDGRRSAVCDDPQGAAFALIERG